MAQVPLSNADVFDDFMKTYSVILYPSGDSGQADFLDRRYAIMRLNCVSSASIERYAGLYNVSRSDFSCDRIHHISEKVGFFSAAMIPRLSRVDPYFNRYVLTALPQYEEFKEGKALEKLKNSLIWKCFKNVAHFYVALPYMFVGPKCSNKAIYKNGMRQLPFRLDLGLLDLNRFHGFLFIAEYIRMLSESLATDEDEAPLMDSRYSWKVPDSYPLGDHLTDLTFGAAATS